VREGAEEVGLERLQRWPCHIVILLYLQM
jgi:hypothetical protein